VQKSEASKQFLKLVIFFIPHTLQFKYSGNRLILFIRRINIQKFVLFANTFLIGRSATNAESGNGAEQLH